MQLRVTFVAAARSSPLLAERFDDDRPLDQAGWDEVQRAAQELGPLVAAELRYCSPTRATPHGGESLLDFISRVGGWLDTRPLDDGGRIVAVAEPSVIRAALVYALKAPPSTYWNLDVRPLSTVVVTGRAGRWNLRFEGVFPPSARG
ncbi:MAG: histidine phosphatase family protein [Streptomyces turgidiscabies]|nr:histidine phosphatase family protein [Streptomyces turgidiscabies]